jgi:peroxin-6
MLYLGVPDSNEAQMNVVRALTRKFRLHPALSLSEVVSKCPFHFTGADLYALCSDAILIAMSRQTEQVDKTIGKYVSFSALPALLSRSTVLLNQAQSSNHPHPITAHYYLSEMAVEQDIQVLVTQQDFDLALSQLKPSVTESELQHYMHIQKSFSGGMFGGADANVENISTD